MHLIQQRGRGGGRRSSALKVHLHDSVKRQLALPARAHPMSLKRLRLSSPVCSRKSLTVRTTPLLAPGAAPLPLPPLLPPTRAGASCTAPPAAWHNTCSITAGRVRGARPGSRAATQRPASLQLRHPDDPRTRFLTHTLALVRPPGRSAAASVCGGSWRGRGAAGSAGSKPAAGRGRWPPGPLPAQQSGCR